MKFGRNGTLTERNVRVFRAKYALVQRLYLRLLHHHTQHIVERRQVSLTHVQNCLDLLFPEAHFGEPLRVLRLAFFYALKSLRDIYTKRVAIRVDQLHGFICKRTLTSV